MKRDEAIACGLLLLLFVAIRVWAARALAFDLVEPEELLNLRLVRQIAAGHEIGELGRYWYTGVGGNTGAGPFVIAALYVPLGWLMEADLAMCRVMGTLWATAGAVGLALLGRDLLGRGGAAAGLAAALTMPPGWVAWGLMAYGNYVEGAVLTLYAAWALLRATRSDGREQLLWAGGFGFGIAFACWFSVSAAAPALALFAVAFVRWAMSPRCLMAMVAGAIVAFGPALAGFAPAAEVTTPVSSDAVAGVARGVLADPLAWPSIAWGSWFGLPLMEWRETVPEDWAPAWLTALQPLALAVGLAVTVALARWSWPSPAGWRAAVPRPGAGAGGTALAPEPRWGLAAGSPVVLALAASALAIPAVLTALGVGPDRVDVEQLYFYDGRRAAMVYVVIALGTAVFGWRLWRGGVVGRAFVGAWVLASVITTGTMLTTAEAPAQALHPVRYMVCPAEEPVLESGVCIDALWEDQVAALEALVLRPELAGATDARREALQGFGALMREDEETCRAGGVPGGEHAAFGFGAGLATACPERVGELCGTTSDDAACRDGAAWAGGL